MKAPVRKAAFLLIGLLGGGCLFPLPAPANDVRAARDDRIGQDFSSRLDRLLGRSAGGDPEAVQADVIELADLARDHIRQVGETQALHDFSQGGWNRTANGLHLWGVTTSGISWFDMGHPELVGTDTSSMSDIEGRNWADLARMSADGTGRKVFTILFPHPRTRRSALGFHTCFSMPDDPTKILCAGAFEDADE